MRTLAGWCLASTTRHGTLLSFSGEGDFLALGPGDFMLLFPEDAHMPRIAVGAPAPVRKVVVKIAVGL